LRNFAGLLATTLLATFSMIGCDRPPAEPVTFAEHIGPLIQARCSDCHTEKTKGDLSLLTREAALEGGKSGAVIIEGKAKKSRLYKIVTGKIEGKRIPPQGEGLTKDQTTLIRHWINGGAQ